MILVEGSPITDIMLCNVPWNVSYQNVILFNSLQAQENYIAAHTVHSYVKAKPVKNNLLSVPVNYDNLVNCNYVAYKNKNFGNKWFYAFIVGRRYVNPNMTELSIEIDSWGTYWKKMSRGAGYIVRHHSNVDTIGSNRIPENFELGNYINIGQDWPKTRGTIQRKFLADSLTPVIWCSDYPDDGYFDLRFDIIGSNFNGFNYNGLYGLVVKDNVNEDVSNILEVALQKFAQDNKVNSIVCISVLDRLVSNISDLENNPGDDVSRKVDYFYTPPERSNFFQGYIPKNNKLYTYPYCMLEVNSNSGEIQRFSLEDFPEYINNGRVPFQGFMDTSPNPTAVFTPIGYRMGTNHPNYNYKMTLQNLPVFSYTTDSYKAWLAQMGGLDYLKGTMKRDVNVAEANRNLGIQQNELSRQTQSQLNNLSGSFGTLSSLMHLDIFGAAETGLSSYINQRNIEQSANINADKINLNANASIQQRIADYNAQMRVAESMGDSAASGSPNVYASINMFGFWCEVSTIRAEFAQIIDLYWEKYGYPVHRLGVPNIHNRSNWDYVQVIDTPIYGDIPNTDRTNLKQMFENGVTFWHDPEHFLDYSRNNSII